MCGIAGALIALHANRQKNAAIVQTIVHDQQMRGPDSQQVVTIPAASSQLILGHNRLKIIDLSDAANQPMFDEQRQFCMVYNGEIYNYLELQSLLRAEGIRFSTHSDTEVLLKACMHWGVEKTLSQLNGMFAFAFYDIAQQRLWLCRDRFGVKPLYYFVHDNHLYFASTTRILAEQFQLKPNLEYLARGIHYWLYEDNSAVSAYEKLQALPASHYLTATFSHDKLQITDPYLYYNLAEKVFALQANLAQQTPQMLMDQTAHYLDSAVELRLRADVPIGISLSGGMDSSTIATIAARKDANIVGFTFGHPEQSYSEGPEVAQLAKALALKVHYIKPTIAQLNDAFLPTLLAQDAPFAGYSIIAQYLVYQAVKQAGIRVLLGGQGGDEIFMGYRKFFWFYGRQLLREKQYIKLLAFLGGLVPSCVAELTHARQYIAGARRYHMKSPDSAILQVPTVGMPSLFSAAQTSLSLRQVADVMQFSLPTLLRYEDRNSMAHSIESRLPFLDYRLVELAIALPATLKLHRGYGKWALRTIAPDDLPQRIRWARAKRGFDVPEKNWIQQGFGKILRAELLKVQSTIAAITTKNLSINQVFADNQLLSEPGLFRIAVSLIWYGHRARS